VLSQATTPLLDQLHRCATRSQAAFFAPGHKRGQGISDRLRFLMGDRPFQADLPELPELDNLFAPTGVIQAAQQLAAEAFGAGRTWFLANGSTCGIEAAILATCQPGDAVLLPRNSHQSAVAALILAGAIPVFLDPAYDSDWGIAGGVTADQVAAALAEHPAIAAVLLVSPTYHGVCSNLAAIAPIVQSRGIPLIVDEAHGGHFAFHPAFPTAALRAGADLVIQSTHKVLGAFTQASMLHQSQASLAAAPAWGDRLDAALQLVQSTSPNYLLLASLDAARHQMATQGQRLLEQALTLAVTAQAGIRARPPLALLGDRPFHENSGFAAQDPTRLTVRVAELGITGFEADEILHGQGVTAELPELTHLTFLLTFGNTPGDIQRLLAGLDRLCHVAPALPLPVAQTIAPPPALPPLLCSPREAFFAPSITLPLRTSLGQVSTRIVCPYPPGIPVLVPGEGITSEAIALLEAVLTAGGQVTGLVKGEPGEHYLQVVHP
jgi:arginine decarboxylase